MGEWIKFADRAPSDDTYDYLCVIDGSNANIPDYCRVLTWHRGEWYMHKNEYSPVLHWMVIPPVPKP